MKDAKSFNLKGYMFDFDGTLVDSMPHWAQAMLNVLNNANAHYPADIIKTITPMGLFSTCRYLHEEFGVGATADDVVKMVDAELFPQYSENILIKPFVKEKLTELKAAGKSVNVLTASPHRWVDPCLKKNGVFDLFDFVWTYEDFKTPKTNPATYVEAAARLNIPLKECSFLDDNIVACIAAKKSGIITGGVYDITSAPKCEWQNGACDFYIESFKEL